ncbi:hypothetical protein AADZ90_007845 [Aestuariibius sp. 2305UL40-4]|uniref:hypothetical protein n=1 Tax=Aestuariibius violaceus TaxID=3234132 RepID=UPI00345E22E0
MRPLALGLAFLAAPVLADAVEAEKEAYTRDRAALEACTDAAADFESFMACTRTTVEACRERRPDGRSNAGGTACLYDELRIWTELYQQEVAGILRWAQDFDSDASRLRASWGRAHETVLRAEVSWAEYVRDQCNMENVGYAAGTAAASGQAACRLRLHAERVFHLRSLDDLRPRDER